ncbi:hypothetical protein UFOVP387_5 [uncultured Caudovirales phage]|uniref:Uncharacterized protein n=1 Tax=uncultured Caudovirales phage TaxID=2100421 RepID=A0A6J7WZW9_9CAUD|nr:hypothetical protein UFOVP387_5 [uncultured Caudovirales phage]
MEKIKVTVNYCNIEFEVKGFYLKGDSYDNTGSCIEDDEILIQGIDVYEILSTKQYNDIIDLAIEEIES